MLTMINSARQCERRVREIRRETAAAVAAKAELATGHAELAAARTAFEQHRAAELAEIQVHAGRAQALMDAAARKEYDVAAREQRIYEKEQLWKFTNESDENVHRGFREPENGTALDKARAAYGLSDDAPVSEPLPDGNDPAFSEGMPPGATLTRAAQTRPARSRPARADQ
jgi:hypothetical protein